MHRGLHLDTYDCVWGKLSFFIADAFWKLVRPSNFNYVSTNGCLCVLAKSLCGFSRTKTVGFQSFSCLHSYLFLFVHFCYFLISECAGVLLTVVADSQKLNCSGKDVYSALLIESKCQIKHSFGNVFIQFCYRDMNSLVFHLYFPFAPEQVTRVTEGKAMNP